MSKVYVAQAQLIRDDAGNWKPKVDLSPAREYGNIVALSGNNSTTGADKEFEILMSDALQDFDPEQDYLLPVGDPFAIVAMGMLTRRGRVLCWDRRLRRYFVREIIG